MASSEIGKIKRSGVSGVRTLPLENKNARGGVYWNLD
jgi:hypothetical protein